MPINPKLLAILVCPETKAPLVEDGDTLVSTHPQIRRRYKVDEGIPVMLVDKSELLSEEEWKEIMTRCHGTPFEAR